MAMLGNVKRSSRPYVKWSDSCMVIYSSLLKYIPIIAVAAHNVNGDIITVKSVAFGYIIITKKIRKELTLWQL